RHRAARQHGRRRRVLRRHSARDLCPAGALHPDLYRQRGGLSRSADRFRTGPRSAVGRRGAAPDRLFQCGVQRDAGDPDLPRGTPEMRSRLYGVLSVCIGVSPLGFLWIGLLADAIGASEATAITGLMGLAALLLTRRWWRQLGAA